MGRKACDLNGFSATEGMRLFDSLPSRPRRGSNLALAVGVFDGMHRGHQAVLKAAVRMGDTLGLRPAVLSFDPPPEAALGLPVPPRVGHPAEHDELMAALGLRERYRVPFTAALAGMSPEAFARDVLAATLGCAAVVVGANFRFGAGAVGTLASLRTLGRRHGFVARGVAPCRVGGELVSSTRLRQALRAGRLDAAAAMLGRPWRWRGEVVRGRRLGRTLGFPTANLRGPQMLPPLGVWAGRCRVVGAAKSPWRGFVGNVGRRPTVESGVAEPSVELHLLDFSGNLEGATLEAEFMRRIRPERRFAGLAELTAQIARDARAARGILGLPPVPPSGGPPTGA